MSWGEIDDFEDLYDPLLTDEDVEEIDFYDDLDDEEDDE